MSQILVIDDEQDILMLVKHALEKDGHLISTASNAEKIDISSIFKYDLILLDVMMDKIDGFSFCQKIRDIVDCPIVFLTAKSLESDVSFGLSIGGDDYIKKPFSIAELRARVNAHLRRENREKHHCMTVSNVRFYLNSKEVMVNNCKIPFTKSEYLICEFLARNHGQVFSKERIYEKVFGFEGESDITAITEHIKNIRSKLGAHELSPIETVWGVGYRWK